MRRRAHHLLPALHRAPIRAPRRTPGPSTGRPGRPAGRPPGAGRRTRPHDPLYFHQGWAIHGSDHVPGHPASHGCVRLPRSDARWLGDQVPNGTPVVVHGSTNSFDPATETVWR